jgi:ADP-L-glycero-D-manno-heptose 6-epimerase
MLLVTGGAGFIGSNVIAALNAEGRSDIAVNDSLGSREKWRNLQKRQFADFIPPGEFAGWLNGRKLDAIIHLGAISDTTATDADAVIETNVRFSLSLLDWCADNRVPLLYASSAATYGDGSAGFQDDWSPDGLNRLAPLNLYGWSKHVFDNIVAQRLATRERLPPQVVGFKFFNVFGPNEYHKGHMQSVIATTFEEAAAGRTVRLFKSYRDGIADGDQRRDFIYVDDAVAVVQWALADGRVNGIFNVGTGEARSFRDLVGALFGALRRPPDITYVEMPESLRPRYQYFTQASTRRLRDAGFTAPFLSLEQAVQQYVTGFLAAPDRYR